MKFSVLICTYNRPELLQKTLQSLVVNVHEKPDEVIVVNGGDDAADKVVYKFAQKNIVPIRLLKTQNINLATSRNIGLAYCRGDIVGMTDDDAEVFPDWVTQMKCAHVEHPEAGAIGGPVIGTNRESLVGKVADEITFPSWPTPRYVRTLPGVNISYKRACIEQIGPQDVTLFRGEDVDYNWRLKQLGYEVYFDPAIKVYHFHRPTWRGFFNQHYMYGRAYYLVRHKWPDMYCIYPHTLQRPKDFLKGLHFFAGSIYQPVLQTLRLSTWADRILALPALFGAAWAWRAGMVVEKFS